MNILLVGGKSHFLQLLIEKLNKEIAEIKAEIRTEFMKSEYSAK